jgi:Outer membrane protein beta-barrel domain
MCLPTTAQMYPKSEIMIQPVFFRARPMAALLFFLFFFGIPFSRGQQQPRFKAGVIAGLTASQIDGDQSAGYNKIGLQAGLRGIARLTEKTEGSIEILFAQRGSQSELVQDAANPFAVSLTLNYVEVPVLWHYKDWFVEDDEGGFYRVSINAGLSYARFINGRTKDDFSSLNALLPDFIRKNELSYAVGANIFANRHLGFTFRFVRSIGFMYDPRDWPRPPVEGRPWNAHALYFQAVYLF